MRFFCALLLVGCAQSFLVAPNKPLSHAGLTSRSRACAQQPHLVSLRSNLDISETSADSNPAGINGEKVLQTIKQYVKTPLGAATIALGAISLVLQKAFLQVIWQTVGPLSVIAAIGALIAGKQSKDVFLVVCAGENQNLTLFEMFPQKTTDRRSNQVKQEKVIFTMGALMIGKISKAVFVAVCACERRLILGNVYTQIV
jgi:hypothetical protein